MCVILEKKPNKEIPFNHLLASASRNDHGHGVGIVDRGQLTVIKGLERDPAKAAESVARILEDAEDQLAFVHFRLSTHGNIDEDNVQPFPVLSKEMGNETEMLLFHNGTLSSFKTDPSVSDTRQFVDQIVRPLCLRSAAFLGEEHILEDELIEAVLDEISGWSKFALLSSTGDSMIINRSSGVNTDYGWASNDYSLRASNISSANKRQSQRSSHAVGKVSEFAIRKLEEQMNENSHTAFDSLRPSQKQRMTITDITGADVLDFCFLTPDQYLSLCEDHPELAATLLLDFSEMLYEEKIAYAEAA